jgi:hypothetical protein
MPNRWFTNWGQTLQLGASVLAVCVAIFLKSGFPKVPTWFAAALVGAAIGLVIGLALERFWPRRSAWNPLQLMRTDFLADDQEKTVFKRKLYVTLRNAGETDVIVGPRTRWTSDDMRVNIIPEHVWQLEGPRGARSGDWSKEAPAVRVPPGSLLRTWVGLPNDARKEDVDHFTQSHRAGTLHTSAAPANDVQIKI